jgi:RNA-dependent RNA polymerase
MDLDIVNVDYTANEWDVTKAIAAVLHNEDEFKQPEGERQLNFKVALHARDVGVRNDGTGVLTLPSPKVHLPHSR